MEGKPTLETFPNPHPQRRYLIKHVAGEFTSVCPRTHQPDFGTIQVEYVPGRHCVELKSLKFYLQSYRNRGIFYEDAVNVILNDLVAALRPRWMKVTGEFRPRGGIHSVVTAQHGREPKPAG
jgi:7-cyano-7-deazaguanine reductase